MSSINDIIRSRRSVYPLQYIDKPIPKEILRELLENANHAPTHKLTAPWRFKVFIGNARVKLGDFLANCLLNHNPDAEQSKVEKVRSNSAKAGAVLAIILHRDPQERVPEWEEMAAIACAVENIWLSLSQYGLGGYWSTPGFVSRLGAHIELASNEKCIGLFYIGYCEPANKQIAKGSIDEKTEWFEE